MRFVEEHSAFVLVRNLGHRVGVASVAILLLSGISVGQEPPDTGSIIAWGGNSYGQTDVPLPNSGFVAVAAGAEHALGLRADGTVVAWGSNWQGETDVPAPNSGFIAIAAGYSHSLGLKSDGTIVAWGGNGEGTADVPAPNTGFVAIAAGGYHSLGLKSDGTIVAWGWNLHGQINVPGPNSGFIAISAGNAHSMGVKADGSIVAWGLNASGQTSVPAPNSGFIAIAAGFSHSLGLKDDGSVVAWGGSTNVPLPNSGFISIAAFVHSMGLKEDGSIVAWGSGWSGKTYVPDPNSDFIAITAGAGYSAAIRTGGPTFFLDGDIPGATFFNNQQLDVDSIVVGPHGGSGQTGGGVDEFTAAEVTVSVAITERARGISSLDSYGSGTATLGLAEGYIYAEFFGEVELVIPVTTPCYTRSSSSSEGGGDYYDNLFTFDRSFDSQIPPGVHSLYLEALVEASDYCPDCHSITFDRRRQVVFGRLGDLNGDGKVGVADLLMLLAAWGPCDDWFDCLADFNGNGEVGVSDLLILLSNWG